MPYCGRASGVLSTFTVIAHRFVDAPVASTRPVSGAIGPAGACTRFTVVVAPGPLAVECVDPPPHAASATIVSSATTTPEDDARLVVFLRVIRTRDGTGCARREDDFGPPLQGGGPKVG